MNFRHPFISNPRLAIFYAIFWLFVATVFVVVQVLANDKGFGVAMVEVFSFIILFAFIGTAIWYVINFSTIEDNSIFRILLAHAIAASIIVFIWMYAGIVILKLLHPDPGGWIETGLLKRTITGYGLYVIYVIFFYAVNYYQGFKDKLRNEGRLKTLIKEAELHALKSQINPHFLFNSLNSISSLTMTDPAKAQEMVINLSQLMRYSLKHNQNEKVTLQQELDNNRLYLHLEKVRFGKKLNTIFDVNEDCKHAEIPNMILQPLYENAIKYGVYEATDPVDVVTKARLVNNKLEVEIQNTYDHDAVSEKGEGIGLRNIRDRLQIIYGDPFLLRIKDDKKTFTVTLSIPQN